MKTNILKVPFRTAPKYNNEISVYKSKKTGTTVGGIEPWNHRVLGQKKTTITGVLAHLR